MTQTDPAPWHPSRILVVADLVPGLVEFLATRRPELEIRGAPATAIGPADLDWAQVFIGFRKPAAPGWGSVRWIHVTGAGVDKLLAGDPLPGSVLLTRSPEDFGPAIGEWCVARALSVNQHLDQHAEDQAARRWNRDLEPVMLAGQQVLILGTGLVGRGVARAFRALGGRVRGLSRSGAGADDFESVLPASRFAEAIPGTDWLVLAAPLTAETRHWLGRERLEQCGGAYLLNVGRGALVDEALIPEAIDRGWLEGAALDVFEREPLDPGSPLWNHPKVVISPHVSGPSTLAATGLGFLQCLESIERGERSRWIIDPDRGY
jgi:phosphoglycerate dehydrogenase-like enzyme